MQTQITPRRVIEMETEELGEEPGDELGAISWDTRVSKRPSKPNLPSVPKPSKILLQQGFSEPCLV